jgi:hypothetical protein
MHWRTYKRLCRSYEDAKSRSVERIMRCASRLLRRMPDRKRTKSPRRRRSRLSGLGTRSGLTRGRAAELKRKNGATCGVVCGAKTPRRKNLSPDNAAWRTTAPPICGSNRRCRTSALPPKADIAERNQDVR